MTKRKYKRPSSPAQIAAVKALREQARQDREIADAERIARGEIVAADIAALDADPDIEVNLDPRGVPVRITRKDVFAMLLSRKIITIAQHAAVRRLETDLAIARQEADHGSSSASRVGCSVVPNRVIRAIAARERLTIIWLVTGIWYRDLLCALMEPQAALFTRWRATVDRAIDEDSERVQTGLIRHACASLADAYARYDMGATKKTA